MQCKLSSNIRIAGKNKDSARRVAAEIFLRLDHAHPVILLSRFPKTKTTLHASKQRQTLLDQTFCRKSSPKDSVFFPEIFSQFFRCSEIMQNERSNLGVGAVQNHNLPSRVEFLQIHCRGADHLRRMCILRIPHCPRNDAKR
jgi:hypothetical protein